MTTPEHPQPDPHWYENLAPVQGIAELTPSLFGLVDTAEVQYGWALNSSRYPDNLRIQQRAAYGLLAFTADKCSTAGLWHVHRSIDSDATKGFSFSPPREMWQILPVRLSEYEAARDIKGAAHYVAGVLFAPWGRI